MDRLLLHIGYLLKNHDCVIVPSLGAFLVVRHGAAIDEATGRIMPPVREYTFNASISHNDGLLANSIARRDNVGFEEGSRRVMAGVAMLKDYLLQFGQIGLPGIGRLTMGLEGNISFIPALPPFIRARRLGILPIENSNKTEEAKSPEVELFDPKRHIRRKKGYWYMPVPKAACWVLLLVMAVCSCFMLKAPVIGSGQQSHYTASVLPICVKESKDSQADISNTTAPQATEDIEQAFTAEAMPYHLIVATFHSADEADKFIEEHSGNGYDLQIVSSRGLYRISAANAADATPLYALAADKDFRHTFPESWVFHP